MNNKNFRQTLIAIAAGTLLAGAGMVSAQAPAEPTAVFVHPLTGKVFQEGSPSKLTEEDIKAKVTAAGYQNIKDVEYKNGLWTADAETGKGNNVDLVIDPDDGSVINAAND